MSTPTDTFVIRPATAADHAVYARLLPELGVDDPVPAPERFAAELAPGTIVLEAQAPGAAAGRVLGLLYFQVLRGVGYVRQLIVDPSARGRRLGEHLMRAAAARMRDGGCARWCLNVKPDNVAAIRLYERMGMRGQYRSTALRFDWAIRDRLPNAPPALSADVPAPGEDAAIEEAMGLQPGLLAEGRRAARTLRVLRAAEDIAGVASFDPRFPGAFPFRARTPAHARALLDALAPHALPEPPYMQVVVEDDAALTAALIAAGATVRVEILHMEGPIA